MIRLFSFAFLFLVLAITVTWFGEDVHRNRYLPPSVDLLTATAEQISQQLQNRSITSLQLVKERVRRIELDNTQGFGLQAVMNVVPYETLIEMAKTRDVERMANNIHGPLLRIPIIVKVNNESP
ncbi:uncharacterized protein TRUGW13939_11969 [Talaromyces rugulosus]|uniref:Uncharacterized protein n=1 Tax=Talaromyces rugulosus TaxID=121627 RepID=A0A7H8RJG8_TALRU|nr:uncharacterized protein TRUGW13939_11969 [Talaromyces rugulosus]QKX64793.1 hypothetical protein TRUGW13939_11969 [Talaromyces rugulosus]